MSKSDFISGIYNYCDRWCERCSYTERCRVHFDTERSARRLRRKGQDPESIDAALAQMGRSFKQVHRMLARSAKAQGLDLDELAARTDMAEEEEAHQAAENHPVALIAGEYTDACAKLLERLHEVFNDSADDARQRARFMDVAAEAEHLLEVREAVEVLGWDHMLITVKIMRAVRSQMDAQREDPEWADVSIQDAAGSASVARRCLGRSKTALLTIYEWDEQFRDEAIGLLAQAEKIEAELAEQIPGCMDFTWPPPEVAEA